MSYTWYSDVERYVCCVINEMRASLKLLDSSNVDRYKPHMAMMLEEMQTLVNRMEAGLSEQKNLKRLHTEVAKLKKECKTLDALATKKGRKEDPE